MKILAINGSPRKSWNTATLLQKALEGGAASGAGTELIHLYELNYKGCTSCFTCKKIDGKRACAMRDDLTPVLEKMKDASALIFGSPIYFGHITSGLAACLERFLYPYVIYSRETPSVFPGKLATAFIYTMNISEEILARLKPKLNSFEAPAARVLGEKPEILCSCDTWQYPDYSKYEHSMFSLEDKARQKAERFPLDCEAAYHLGARLSQKAAELAGKCSAA
ncbi:MAG: flavodoxin family protein [Dehalococcoidia bacterium]|nr:flavodoxin family protein [Dehalococcoidia bacterium]